MKLYLNEKIKKLRTEKGLTQKSLAQLLNVSSQAISRWEMGSTYPDIELLPEIANVFGITIDELLDCKTKVFENTQKYIEKYYELYDGGIGNIKEAIKVLEEGLKENPNNIRLRFLLITALPYINENERIISESKKIENKLSNSQKNELYMIVSLAYYKLGNKALAKEYADKLPISLYWDFYPHIAEGKDKQEAIQTNIKRRIISLLCDIDNLVALKQYSKGEKIKIIDKVPKILEVLYENKDYSLGEYFSLLNFELRLSLIYQEDDVKQVINHLKKAIDYAKTLDEMKVEKHSSLLNNLMFLNLSSKRRKYIDYVKKEISSDVYSGIRNSKQFKEIEQELY